MKQAVGEPVSVFIVRCTQSAADCEFQCPESQFDLSEYVLLRKVMTGLSDSSMRQEVFRQCEGFSDMDILRGFCAAYEAAKHDSAASEGFSRASQVAGANVTSWWH